MRRQRPALACSRHDRGRCWRRCGRHVVRVAHIEVDNPSVEVLAFWGLVKGVAFLADGRGHQHHRQNPSIGSPQADGRVRQEVWVGVAPDEPSFMVHLTTPSVAIVGAITRRDGVDSGGRKASGMCRSGGRIWRHGPKGCRSSGASKETPARFSTPAS